MQAEVAPSEALETIDYGICPICGYVMLPVLPLLPCGHSEEPLLNPLNELGTVFSWTTVRLGDAGQPVAMADFLDGQLRVTAPVLNAGTVAIGDKVKLTIGRDTPYGLNRVAQ